MKNWFLTLALILLISQTPALACTVIIYADGHVTLGGNNEDWKNPKTHMWSVPGESGQYGRIYFGFDDKMPQGGMNDKGLFFDGLATSPKIVTKSRHKPDCPSNLFEKVLAECDSVKQALALVDQYNLSDMKNFMIMIGDRHGDAAIIEGDEIIHKRGNYQISTNFYQTDFQKADFPCERYKIAYSMLENTDSGSVDFMRSVLAAVHAEGKYPTQYSNIYDLKNGLIYLYHFHNFENVVVVDVKKELAKEAYDVELISLFPRSFAAEVYLDNND